MATSKDPGTFRLRPPKEFRLRSASVSFDENIPCKCYRITINLAPANVRKEGPSFDLPIALGMLKLEEKNRLPDLDAFCISGELALSGQLRPVKGVLSIALEAKRRHRQTLIVPVVNAAEAAVVEGIGVYGASSLSEVVHFLRGDISLAQVRSNNDWSDAGSGDQELDFGEVKGQQHVKRAVEVAAAGRHNILCIGPAERADLGGRSGAELVTA